MHAIKAQYLAFFSFPSFPLKEYQRAPISQAWSPEALLLAFSIMRLVPTLFTRQALPHPSTFV
jgi:hypothetical protein